MQHDFVITNAVQRHQVRRYLIALGVEWTEDDTLPGDSTGFAVPDATDEQWAHIEAWVKKVKAAPAGG